MSQNHERPRITSAGMTDPFALSLELAVNELGIRLPNDRAYVLDVGCGFMTYWRSIMGALTGEAMLSGDTRKVTLIGIDNHDNVNQAIDFLVDSGYNRNHNALYTNGSVLMLLQDRINESSDIQRIMDRTTVLPRIDLLMALGIGPQVCSGYVDTLIRAGSGKELSNTPILLGLTGECYEADHFMKVAKAVGFRHINKIFDPLWTEQMEASGPAKISSGRKVVNPINEYIVLRQ